MRFQSAPPRGGRLGPVGPPRPVGLVSIRAPAWGATVDHFYVGTVGLVSIRAPAWGATEVSAFWTDQDTGFNPRPRVGGDLPGRWRHIFWGVSIRAPAWGATVDGDHIMGESRVSIRAPAWGATGHAALNAGRQERFQSAPPRGGRPSVAQGWQTLKIHPPCREPTQKRQSLPPFSKSLKSTSCNINFFYNASPQGISRVLGVRTAYTIKGPSGSTDGLAPTCSTRPRQFAPR